MPKKLDHVAVAVRSIDESLRVFRDLLGLEFHGIESVDEQGVKVAVLKAGETRIELLEPTSAASPVARFLEKKGEGLHHVAVAVERLEEEVERLAAMGVRFVSKEPRGGAGGAKIVFLHPSATAGVLVELVER